MKETYQIRPIGHVRREDPESADREAECAIELRPDLEPGLLGVEPGDRLQVLWWMHRLTDRDRAVLRCHPMGDRSRPKRGVFALRSPMRPNPIGSTVVQVLRVEGVRLTVRGLDALDGSPVVDLKIAPRD